MAVETWIGAISLILSLSGLAIAVHQVHGARKVNRIAGKISAIEAFLAAQHQGARDRDSIERLNALLFKELEKLGGRIMLKEIEEALFGK